MDREIGMITSQLGTALWFWGMALGFIIAKFFYWDVIQDDIFEIRDRDEGNRKSGYAVIGFFFVCWILALLLTLTNPEVL